MSSSTTDISDLAARCIRCGFCLESCPTFAVTGSEAESPRGRIYLIRNADAGLIQWEETREHIDQCVGCRACETACPSGVEYGALLELARHKLEIRRPHRAKKLLLTSITKPLLLRLQLLLAPLTPGKKIPDLLSGFLSRQKPEAFKPTPQKTPKWAALDESSLPPVKGEILLLEGCAMKVLFPSVNLATRRLLRRLGYTSKTINGCCGALHAHNGHLPEALKMAEQVAKQSTINNRQSTILTNSAGCGSFLKEHTGLPIQDISEFLVENGLPELLAKTKGFATNATYHDACHLAHGQGIRSQPRKLLQSIPNLQLTELHEADMCCGSGGIYNLTQPTMARHLLERKWANVEATGAEIVVTGNPGCHAWLQQASEEADGDIVVMHTVELLELTFISSSS